MAGDVEQAAPRAERLGPPVPATDLAGAEERAVADARYARGIVRRTAGERIDAREYVVVHERPRLEESNAARAAREQPEVAVPPGVHEGADAPSPEIEVHQQGRDSLVPVPGSIPVILVVCHEPAGIRVQGDGGRSEQVVARARVARPWPPVADAPVGDVEVGIVGAGQPDCPAAGPPIVTLPRRATELARARDRVEAPHLVAGRRIVGGDEAADTVLTARRADEHLAVDHERGHRDVVVAAVVPGRTLPDEPSGRRVQSDDARVEGSNVHAVVVQRYAAVVRAPARPVLGESMHMAPQERPRCGIEGHYPVGGGHEHDAAVHDRGRLRPRAVVRVGLEPPGRHQVGDVRGVDLPQRAESQPVVRAAVHQPVLRIGVPEPLVGYRSVGAERRFLPGHGSRDGSSDDDNDDGARHAHQPPRPEIVARGSDSRPTI